MRIGPPYPLLVRRDNFRLMVDDYSSCIWRVQMYDIAYIVRSGHISLAMALVLPCIFHHGPTQ